MFGLICGEDLQNNIIRRTKIFRKYGRIYYKHTKCPSCGKMEMELVDPAILTFKGTPVGTYLVAVTYNRETNKWDQKMIGLNDQRKWVVIAIDDPVNSPVKDVVEV